MTNSFQNGIAEVIQNGIKRPICLLLEHKCYPAALILAYSGIDTMAYLNMPAERTDVMRSDFIAWAEQYVNLTSSAGQVAASDLYGARCSVLHGGAQSRFTREGRGRPILYTYGARGCASRESGSAEKPLFIIDLEKLIEAFFAGIDRFLADLSASAGKIEIAKRRMDHLQASLPFSRQFHTEREERK